MKILYDENPPIETVCDHGFDTYLQIVYSYIVLDTAYQC